MYGGGCLPQESVVDGFRVMPLSGTITSATVKLFGVKRNIMSALRLINETIATDGVAEVNVTDVFSSDFDIYKIV